MAKIGVDIDELRAVFDLIGAGGSPDQLEDDSVKLVYDLSRVLGGGWQSEQPAGEPFLAHVALAAGGAGIFNHWRLRNPQNSTRLIVFELISHQTSTVQQLSVTLLGSVDDLATGMTERARNFGLNVTPVGIASYSQVVSGSSGHWDLRTSAANVKNEHTFGGPFIVPPGAIIQFTGEVANSTGTVTMYWRERELR